MIKKIIKKIIKKNNKMTLIRRTPLHICEYLSNKYKCNIYLKREDLQKVRSFKIRGAYNKIMNNLSTNNIYVTASAGNHAQGVAYVCSKIKKKHYIFLPQNTPKQKIERIKYFGGNYLNLNIINDNLNNILQISQKFSEENNYNYIHPFDDKDVIMGQGKILSEIYDEITPDLLIVPVGGGGLISGILEYKEKLNINTQIIGVEPQGSCSLYNSLKYKKITSIENNDDFVDGASVKTVGNLNFKICNKHNLSHENIKLINNNHLCHTLVELYQNEGIISEPAGALSISALDKIDKKLLKNKNIVCIISGGNNDIMRYSTFIEKSLIHAGLKHYFIIKFNQVPGELKDFVNKITSDTIDITRFEYLKKNNDKGNVLIGLDLTYKEQLNTLLKNMNNNNIKYTKINHDEYLINI
jgi:threonine dehydratase